MNSLSSFQQLRALIENIKHPVVLLEGTRTVSEEVASQLETVGAALAKHFPTVIFRSGNAPGSDEHFSRGVASVDVSRLEIVVPYARHRLNERPEGARVLSLDELKNQDELRRLTLAASPFYEFLAASSASSSKAKFSYLLRDTLKITGALEHEFNPAMAGLFFVNEKKPTSGGTAHTLRICSSLSVATATQTIWSDWNFTHAE